MSDWNLAAFRERVRTLRTGTDFAAYRKRPEAFAREVLGSRWWSKQREVASLLASHRRVAVRSANGVGKSYLAADLALWFLMCHAPAVVLTTAPTDRQVRHVLWREIRLRFASARVSLPGRLLEQRLEMGPNWHAMGFSTDQAVALQGFHAENLLIVFDEASGVPDEMWEAAEGVAVGTNNRILAIGNPLVPRGRFYEVFRDRTSWITEVIAALDHPNVTGDEPPIAGCVTPETIGALAAEWCEETEDDGPDGFSWNGKRYRPSNPFRVRVLGQFPEEADDSLFLLRWIEEAMERELRPDGDRRVAADIARFGSDETAIGARVGPVMTRLVTSRREELRATAGRIASLARETQAQSVVVDAAGLGCGAAEMLQDQDLPWVEEFVGAAAANDPERFLNRRAESYWGLRERFRQGDIAIPKDAALREQLMSIRYSLTPRGQIKIEAKEELRRRGRPSPDRADMLAMLFDSSAISAGWTLGAVEGPSERLRQQMANW
jgi:hypothetical protein